MQVNQWGNSLAVRIPKSFAEHIHIKSGSEIEMNITDDSIVLSKPTYSLDNLLNNVTPKNLHDETDWGTPQGNEVW